MAAKRQRVTMLTRLLPEEHLLAVPKQREEAGKPMAMAITITILVPLTRWISLRGKVTVVRLREPYFQPMALRIFSRGA